MEKKRYWNEELLRILPETTDVIESEETTLYTFPYAAGCKDAEVTIRIHSGYAILRAKREYASGIKEKETVHFNETAQSDYYGYQIFTEGNIFYVTKRFTFERTEELLENITAFLEIVVTVVERFEKQCIDFLETDRENAEKSSMEINEHHTTREDTSSVAEFLKYQLYFCNDIFCKMAAKYAADIEVAEDELFFKTNIDNHDVVVSMKKETGDMTIDFSFLAGEDHSYRMISEFKRRNKNLYYSYLNGKIHVKSFLTPDPGLPDEAFCMMDQILDLLKNQKADRNDGNLHEIPMQMVSEMQTLMDTQMEALKNKSSELEKREKELLVKEKNRKNRENFLDRKENRSKNSCRNQRKK